MVKPADSHSDDELIELCNRGGQREAASAFNELYRRHSDYVVRVSMRLCGDTEIATDVLQEAFLYLLRKFPPTGEGLRLTARLTSLLYPVAKNLTLNALERNRRHAGDSDVDPQSLAGALEPAGDIDLETLLESLSAEKREILMLRFVDGFALGEIAEILAIPLGTVKSRLHLAVAALKKSNAIRELRSL